MKMIKSLILAAGLLWSSSALAIVPVVGMVPGNEYIVCDTEAQIVEIAQGWLEGGSMGGREVYQRLHKEKSIYPDDVACLFQTPSSTTIFAFKEIVGDFLFEGKKLEIFVVELSAITNPDFHYFAFWPHNPAEIPPGERAS